MPYYVIAELLGGGLAGLFAIFRDKNLETKPEPEPKRAHSSGTLPLGEPLTLNES